MFFLRIDSLNPNLLTQENNIESEASSSSSPNPQNAIITINDPRIKPVNGISHLYRNAPHPLPSTSHSSHDPLPLLPVERGTLVFVLAVPNRLTVEDFLRFCGPVADPASDITVIRNDAVEDRYCVLVKFDDQKSADDFYRYVNGWRYPEGEVCHTLFLDSVVHVESTDIAGTSPAGSTELPTCPVCLERLDQDISGITATTCDHSFYCSCISEWANSSCSVCHFCQEHSQKPACSICGTSGIPWICIICGFVGCGRYERGHALSHWKSTQHCYTLDLETQHVWDYVGHTYVHWLNQSRSESNGECCDNLTCTDDSSVNAAMSNSKIISIVVEYNWLLESQLETQRQYYEALIKEVSPVISPALDAQLEEVLPSHGEESEKDGAQHSEDDDLDFLLFAEDMNSSIRDVNVAPVLQGAKESEEAGGASVNVMLNPINEVLEIPRGGDALESQQELVVPPSEKEAGESSVPAQHPEVLSSPSLEDVTMDSVSEAVGWLKERIGGAVRDIAQTKHDDDLLLQAFIKQKRTCTDRDEALLKRADVVLQLIFTKCRRLEAEREEAIAALALVQMDKEEAVELRAAVVAKDEKVALLEAEILLRGRVLEKTRSFINRWGDFMEVHVQRVAGMEERLNKCAATFKECSGEVVTLAAGRQSEMAGAALVKEELAKALAKVEKLEGGKKAVEEKAKRALEATSTTLHTLWRAHNRQLNLDCYGPERKAKVIKMLLKKDEEREHAKGAAPSGSK